MNTPNGQQFENSPTLKALQADIEGLKRDLAKALSGLESKATMSTGAIRKIIANTASELTDDLSAGADRARKTLTGHVEQQPLASIAIAFITGFIASRFLTR